ncbi:MAG: TonB family protein [Myxococcota bacterium]
MTSAREVGFLLGGTSRREARRALALSAGGHLVLLGLLIAIPETRFVAPLDTIAVELVASISLPVRAAKRPETRLPSPVPKPPVPQKVVLPEEPVLPEPVVDLEQEYEELMAQLREEMGEEAPERAVAVSPAVPGVRVVSPEVAAWVRKAKIHVRSVWVLSPGFRTQALQTHVAVDLDAGGGVIGEPRVVRRSGNPWYDENVVRAIQKASPLPAPPEAGEWAFVFVPQDSY